MRLPLNRAAVAPAVSALVAAGVGAAATKAANAASSGRSVAYTISSQWTGGFRANVSVTNLGDPVTTWS